MIEPVAILISFIGIQMMDPYVSILALAAGPDLLLFSLIAGVSVWIPILWMKVNVLEGRVAALEVNGDSEEEDGESV